MASGNAIDWLSRPYGAGALHGKRVLAVAASPSERGGVLALEMLRQLLPNVGADVVATATIGEVDRRLADGQSQFVLSQELSAMLHEATNAGCCLV